MEITHEYEIGIYRGVGNYCDGAYTYIYIYIIYNVYTLHI